MSDLSFVPSVTWAAVSVSISLAFMNCSQHYCTLECTYRSLPKHLKSDVSEHLSCALVRIQEQQKVIVGLHHKFGEFQSQLTEIDNKHTAALAGVVGTVAALELADKKTQKTLANEISRVETKAARATSDLASELRGEITKIKRNIVDITPKK